MNFYLSSYRLGNEIGALKRLLRGKRVGYVPNAGDFSRADPVKSKEVTKRDLRDLSDLGIAIEPLDLRDYFGRKEFLRDTLADMSGIWVRGGNTFVLRQAMRLSGVDELLTRELIERCDFTYAGYSAAGCVLSPSLTCYQIVDDPTETPYQQLNSVLWDGLKLIDVAFMPHYKSNHDESTHIDKEIARCEEQGIAYKALRDGEVWVFARQGQDIQS